MECDNLSAINYCLFFMKQYLDLLRHILENGVAKGDRSGFGLLSTFGYQMRFNLNNGFPLLTTKKMPIKTLTHELLWFLSGSTNIRYLQENNVHIWDTFADEKGELGPVYGSQWRFWPRPEGRYVDQIKNVIAEIKTMPNSKCMIVSAWNAADIKKMRLPPCHTLFQFNVTAGKLSCQLYQRSGDVLLGIPFNIAEYSLLTLMVAQVCDLEPYEFVHTIGDAHLYKNHIEQVKLQLTREPKPLPKMKLNPKIKDIDDFTIDDFELEGYKPHPHIKAPLVEL